MPNLFIVRHGESEKNVLRIINHDPTKPFKLTSTGREQAQTAAKEVAAIQFTHAFASKYPRVQETAAIILGERHCPLVIDARLDEIHNGNLEGRSLDEYRERITDRVGQTPPGGETWADMKARLRDFLDQIRQLEGDILIVSHGHPIAALRGIIGGWDDQRAERAIPRTAEVLRYEL